MEFSEDILWVYIYMTGLGDFDVDFDVVVKTAPDLAAFPQTRLPVVAAEGAHALHPRPLLPLRFGQKTTRSPSGRWQRLPTPCGSRISPWAL
jgi:hypothetical protein